MRVLVTGATGFLGSCFVKFLLHQKIDVVILTRDMGKASRLFGNKVSLRKGELKNKESLISAVEDVEIVFHLAGLTGGAGVISKDFYRVNVDGTKNLLDACESSHIQRFVYCSTANIYGNTGLTPINETVPCNPMGDYEESKHSAETVVLEYGCKGYEIVIIRPSWIYGPGDLKSIGLFRLIQSGRFILIGDGKNLHHPVYIDDIIQGLYQCAIKTVNNSEIFILGGKEIATTHQLVSKIACLLFVTLPRIRVPLGLARFFAIGIGSLCVAGGLKFPVTKDRLEFFCLNRAYNISKAQNLLGYEPATSLDQGLESTVMWYKKYGYL